MRKIIHGRAYDTQTAKRLASWDHGYRTDHAYVAEGLYCKRTGEYFLAGEGGPRSRYATGVGQNMWSGGEGIIPLTQDEAEEWVETHANWLYEEIFGEVTE